MSTSFQDIQTMIAEMKIMVSDQPTSPKTYAELQAASIELELTNECKALESLFNEYKNDPDTLKEKFKELCTAREKQNKDTCLSYTAFPNGHCNELYWKLADKLFQPKSFKEMLEILLPGVQKNLHTEVGFKSRNTMFLTCKISNFVKSDNPSELETFLKKPIEKDPASHFNHCILADGIIVDLKEFESFSLALHMDLYDFLDEKNIPLKKKLYEQSEDLMQILYDIEKIKKSGITPREVLTQTMNAFKLGGVKYGGKEEIATDAAILAGYKFMSYVESLPKKFKERVLNMEGGGKSIREVIRKLNSTQGVDSCVDVAQTVLEAVLKNPENATLLNERPGLTEKEIQAIYNRYKGGCSIHFMSKLPSEDDLKNPDKKDFKNSYIIVNSDLYYIKSNSEVELVPIKNINGFNEILLPLQKNVEEEFVLTKEQITKLILSNGGNYTDKVAVILGPLQKDAVDKAEEEARSTYSMNSPYSFQQNSDNEVDASGIYSMNSPYSFQQNSDNEVDAGGIYSMNSPYSFQQNSDNEVDASGIYSMNSPYSFQQNAENEVGASGIYSMNSPYSFQQNAENEVEANFMNPPSNLLQNAENEAEEEENIILTKEQINTLIASSSENISTDTNTYKEKLSAALQEYAVKEVILPKTQIDKLITSNTGHRPRGIEISVEGHDNSTNIPTVLKAKALKHVVIADINGFVDLLLFLPSEEYGTFLEHVTITVYPPLPDLLRQSLDMLGNPQKVSAFIDALWDNKNKFGGDKAVFDFCTEAEIIDVLDKIPDELLNTLCYDQAKIYDEFSSNALLLKLAASDSPEAINKLIKIWGRLTLTTQCPSLFILNTLKKNKDNPNAINALNKITELMTKELKEIPAIAFPNIVIKNEESFSNLLNFMPSEKYADFFEHADIRMNLRGMPKSLDNYLFLLDNPEKASLFANALWKNKNKFGGDLIVSQFLIQLQNPYVLEKIPNDIVDAWYSNHGTYLLDFVRSDNPNNFDNLLNIWRKLSTVTRKKFWQVPDYNSVFSLLTETNTSKSLSTLEVMLNETIADDFQGACDYCAVRSHDYSISTTPLIINTILNQMVTNEDFLEIGLKQGSTRIPNLFHELVTSRDPELLLIFQQFLTKIPLEKQIAILMIEKDKNVKNVLYHLRWTKDPATISILSSIFDNLLQQSETLNEVILQNENLFTIMSAVFYQEVIDNKGLIIPDSNIKKAGERAEQFLSIIQKFPNSPASSALLLDKALLKNWGIILIENNQKEALNTLRDLIASNPHRQEFFDNLKLHYVSIGQSDKVEQIAEMQKEFLPKLSPDISIQQMPSEKEFLPKLSPDIPVQKMPSEIVKEIQQAPAVSPISIKSTHKNFLDTRPKPKVINESIKADIIKEIRLIIGDLQKSNLSTTLSFKPDTKITLLTKLINYLDHPALCMNTAPSTYQEIFNVWSQEINPKQESAKVLTNLQTVCKQRNVISNIFTSAPSDAGVLVLKLFKTHGNKFVYSTEDRPEPTADKNMKL